MPLGRNARLHSEENPAPATSDPPRDQADDDRTPGRHDRDRLLYAPALRRLAGITQVVSPSERYFAHNRLTHTLKVAQVGRG